MVDIVCSLMEIQKDINREKSIMVSLKIYIISFNFLQHFVFVFIRLFLLKFLGFSFSVFLVAPRINSEYTKEFTQFRIFARGISSADRMTAQFTSMNPRRVGRFQLFDDAIAEFNTDCVNTIKEFDTEQSKSEVQLIWTAPVSGSGCVAISAMLYERSQQWYAENDQLTKIICEGEPAHVDFSHDCCACDEAKYQVC